MSKRRGNRKPSSNKPSPQNNTQPSPEALIAKADELNDSAMEKATGEDLEKFVAVQKTDNPTVDMLRIAIQKSKEAEKLFKIQEQRFTESLAEFEEKEELLSKSQAELSKRESSIKENEAVLSREQRELDEREKSIKEKESYLLKQEEKLKVREVNAEADFAQQRRESLLALEKEAQVLRDELSAHRRKMAEEHAENLRKLEEQRTKFDEKLAARQSVLESEYQEKIRALLDEQLKHKKAKDKYEIELEMLTEDREALQNRIAQGIAKKEADYQFEIQRLKGQAERIQSHRDQLQNKLAVYEEANRRIGNQPPEEIYNELQQVKAERDNLNHQLQTRPDASALERLQYLTAEQERWQQQEFSLKQENQSLKRQVTQNQIAVSELETLRDQKHVLETTNKLLEAAQKQLDEKVNGLLEKVKGTEVFPACMGMDTNDRLQDTQLTDNNESIQLDEFIADLQQRVAYDPETKKELFYSLRDLRSFVAGLAMSRLHLLQGISGTGKTSLPLAVARALGAGHALVEVQAGWRDRHDLIGHFNAFERRFYESEFLQALYKAQCPQYADRLFLIVLDEMNLSHPEQYFADLLSALEQDSDKRGLTLMESPVEPTPNLFTEGRKLKIPENVWFIGTANHDETTVDFAPKTYDRAHVMELPRHQEHFDVDRKLSPRQPIDWNNLHKAFESAWKKHANEAKAAYEFIDLHGDLLHKYFKLGWGNRLQRQMAHYVPVVIAAGGSLGEATDHILASKLLRKLKDRYDNRPDDLRTLKGELEKAFEQAAFKKDFDISQSHSIAILNDELHRLGEDV